MTIVGHPKSLPGSPKSTRFPELDIFEFLRMLKGEIANSKNTMSLRKYPSKTKKISIQINCPFSTIFMTLKQ